MDVRLTDNSKNATGHPNCVDPIAASGITLAVGAGEANDEKTQGLTGGQLYVITPIGMNVFASITGVTSTAANIEWAFPAGVASVFRMPKDKTTLYWRGDTNAKNAYVRKLAGS